MNILINWCHLSQNIQMIQWHKEFFSILDLQELLTWWRMLHRVRQLAICDESFKEYVKELLIPTNNLLCHIYNARISVVIQKFMSTLWPTQRFMLFQFIIQMSHSLSQVLHCPSSFPLLDSYYVKTLWNVHCRFLFDLISYCWNEFIFHCQLLSYTICNDFFLVASKKKKMTM